jgi:hypothetical protein
MAANRWLTASRLGRSVEQQIHGLRTHFHDRPELMPIHQFSGPRVGVTSQARG